MLGLRKLNQCFSLATKVSGHRTLFAPSFFGIDKFTVFSQTTKQRQGENKQSIKSTLSDSLQNQRQIFTEDLKLMVYLADTPEEFDLVINAIKKYEAQANDGAFNFSFGTLLMRLAYTMNQTDKMLELFLSENPSKAFTEMKFGQILMNKLFEEKRYDDCVKVFKRMVKNSGNTQMQMKDGSTRHTFTFNHAIQIVAEALLEKGDSTAMSEMKEIFNDLNSKGIKYNRQTHICMFLLANKHKDFAYADSILQNMSSEVTGFFSASPLNRNLEIINLCNLGKCPEAMDISKQLMVNSKFPQRFFQEALNVLAEEIKKLGDPVLETALKSLNEQVTGANSVVQKSVKDYFIRMQKISPQDLKKMRENDQQGGSGRLFKSASFTKPRKPSILE